MLLIWQCTRLPIILTFRGNRKISCYREFELSTVKLYRKRSEGKWKLLRARVSGRFELSRVRVAVSRLYIPREVCSPLDKLILVSSFLEKNLRRLLGWERCIDFSPGHTVLGLNISHHLYTWPCQLEYLPVLWHPSKYPLWLREPAKTWGTPEKRRSWQQTFSLFFQAVCSSTNWHLIRFSLHPSCL